MSTSRENRSSEENRDDEMVAREAPSSALRGFSVNSAAKSRPKRAGSITESNITKLLSGCWLLVQSTVKRWAMRDEEKYAPDGEEVFV